MRADVSVDWLSDSAEPIAAGSGHLGVKSCPSSCLSANPSCPPLLLQLFVWTTVSLPESQAKAVARCLQRTLQRVHSDDHRTFGLPSAVQLRMLKSLSTFYWLNGAEGFWFSSRTTYISVQVNFLVCKLKNLLNSILCAQNNCGLK